MLECLQKSLRIANSASEDIVTTQLYVDTLDQYVFYLDRGASAVRFTTLFHIRSVLEHLTLSMQVSPKFVNSLVQLITGKIDDISSPDVHPSQRAPAGLLEGVQTPEMITRHFRNTLTLIQRKKAAAEVKEANERWDEVDIVGALLKMGLGAR